jgi:class 3 adenylate cyclase/alpha-beta hydrolase superfamily lysophospholipase
MIGQGEVGYARSGQISIAYTVLGEGPPDIVYVPGFVSHLDLAWDLPFMAGALRGLSQLGRLTTFDKRGTGLSDRTLGFGSFEERVDDIRAVMDEAGVERACLFGVSEGGPLSLLFAATYPERVSRLVIYGSLGARGFWAPSYPAGMPADDFELFTAMIEEAWGTGRALPMFVQHIPDSEEVRRALGRFERSACTPRMAVEVLRRNMEVDIRTLLPTIGVPTLVLHNRGDPRLAIEHARYYAEHIPGARLEERDGDFHISWRPQDMVWVGEQIHDFFAEADEVTAPSAPSLPASRMLTTVLFTDIVGSTVRAAEVGDRAWSDTLDEHDRLIAGAVDLHDGELIKSTGDGALATFDGPSRAIDCARAVVRSVERLGIELRAGIHTGEIERRGADIGGLGVHIAARVADLAGPSEVLVSRTVRDLVTGSQVALDPHGTHSLKGVPDEWELYSIEMSSAS